MSSREELLAHRARLVQRAEEERAELAAIAGEWAKPLRVVDQSVSILRRLQSSPLVRAIAAAGMGALAIVRPRAISGWVDGGRAIWRLFTRARGG